MTPKLKNQAWNLGIIMWFYRDYGNKTVIKADSCPNAEKKNICVVSVSEEKA